MENLCPHRLAPLSEGRVEGDDIRCMYHGIVFTSDGQCKEIPGQEHIPKSLCTESYAVFEDHEWIWVWLGKKDEANYDSLLNVEWHNPDKFLLKKAYIDYEANFQLLNDNLCDLSHVAFVHESSFASALGNGKDWTETAPATTFLDRGVRVDRWIIGMPHPQFPNGERVDVWNTYDYLLPGVFLLDTKVFPTGVAEQSGLKAPDEGLKPLSKTCSAQAITPTGDDSLRYFYSICIPQGEPEQTMQVNFELSKMAFDEDKVMLEAQQKVITKNPNVAMRRTTHDKAGTYFRKLVQGSSDSKRA